MLLKFIMLEKKGESGQNISLAKQESGCKNNVHRRGHPNVEKLI